MPDHRHLSLAIFALLLIGLCAGSPLCGGFIFLVLPTAGLRCHATVWGLSRIL